MVDPDEALFSVAYTSEANVLFYDDTYFFHSTAGGQIYKYPTKASTAAAMYAYVQEKPAISVPVLISKSEKYGKGVLFAYPYTALQDLVLQAASSPDALVFMLNKNPEIKEAVQTTALSVHDFLQKDVISPFIKKYIGSDYIRYQGRAL